MFNHLRKNKKGFTLAEMLMVIAIIAVLLAIAVPGIVKSQKSLKRTELDRTAEEVFLSAQNSLMTMKTAGTWTGALASSGLSGKTAVPGDYAAAATSDYKFYSYSSESRFYRLYLAKDALDALDGVFAVEFIGETADVYSAFYTDDEDLMQNLIDAADSNSLDAFRNNPDIGYYCGGPATLETQYFEDLATLVLDVAPLADDSSSGLYSNYDLVVRTTLRDALSIAATSYKLTYYFEFTDTETGEKTGYSVSGDNAYIGENGFDLVLDQTIDSIGGRHFYKDIAPGFTQGKNINIAVTATYEGVNGTVNTDTASNNRLMGINPVFSTLSTDDEIVIENPRHLNNLNAEYFTATDAYRPEKITQMNDLDFAEVSGYKPIVNEDYLTSSVEFSGKTVWNFNGAGIFGLTGCNINDLVLINPAICISEANAYVGGIACETDGGSLNGCGIRYSSDAIHSVVGEGGGSYVGGLVGKATETRFKDCYSAVNVSGFGYTGGLAGELDGCIVERCYSSGNILNMAPTGYTRTGGFAGIINGGAYVNCYTTSDVITTDYGGGFTGQYRNADMQNCFSYGMVWDGWNRYSENENGHYGGFSPEGLPSGCCFMFQDGYNDFPESYDGGSSYSYLASDGVMRLSYPVSNDLAGQSFPFYIEGFENKPHYGDWPHNYRFIWKDDFTHYVSCGVPGCTYHSEESHTHGDECVICVKP